MGCSSSTTIVQSGEMVKHCQARKESMKQFVRARMEFSTAHVLYIQSLREMGSAFSTFARSIGNLYEPVEEANEQQGAVANRALGEVLGKFDAPFQAAANAGLRVSELLEVQSYNSSNRSQGRRMISFVRQWAGLSPENPDHDHVLNYVADGGESGSHRSTVDMLYSLEKKLYEEVKNERNKKIEQEKKLKSLRKSEMQLTGSEETEKIKRELEKLKADVVLASVHIDNIDEEMRNLRKTQLYPQLKMLLESLMNMWRGMNESHQLQRRLIEQLQQLVHRTRASNDPISDPKVKATMVLELALKKWHEGFRNLFKAKCTYMQCLKIWTKLTLTRVGQNHRETSIEESKVEAICRHWDAVVDAFPENTAAESLRQFVSKLQRIVDQQKVECEQQSQLESMRADLQTLEGRDGHPREGQVDELRQGIQDTENSVAVERQAVLTRLHRGCDEAFQQIVGFSTVAMESFEALHETS